MAEENLYKKYAKYYEKIYSKKDYEKEFNFLKSIVITHNLQGKKILDMGCGTGIHTKELVDFGCDVIGVDINEGMLEIAREKIEKATFVNNSMQQFITEDKFDAIICLFTAINYNKNIVELKQTIKNFHNNLKQGGVLVFDLGVVKGHEDRKIGTSLDIYSDDNLQIGRISQWGINKQEKDSFCLNSIILVKENGKVDFEIDEHNLGVFSCSEVVEILRKFGFKVEIYDDFTFDDYTVNSRRPVFVGIKS